MTRRRQEGAPPPPLEHLKLALPKGRVLDEAMALFARAGIDLASVAASSRRLVHDLGPQPTVNASLTVYVLRDADVPSYVEHGAADVGIAGSDVLEEQARDLYQPLDLGIGRCRLSLAAPQQRRAAMQQEEEAALDEEPHVLRVATKFPRLARRFLEARGVTADIIPLYGSIELGPLTGLADRIVDLVSTGETLRQLDLVALETILEVSARLVVNRASLKLRRRAIDALCERLATAAASPAPASPRASSRAATTRRGRARRDV